MGLECALIQILQHSGDASVQPYPPGQRQFLDQRLLDQPVGELVEADGGRHLFDQASRQRLFQNLQQFVLGQVVDKAVE